MNKEMSEKIALRSSDYLRRGENTNEFQIPEALKGNTKHTVLKPKQVQSTHDQMPKMVRISILLFTIWGEATL